jgi:hypothetical protein
MGEHEELSPRQEKNRRHLISVLSVLVGVALLFVLQCIYGVGRPVVWISGVLYLVILGLRTLFVELGIRRPLSTRQARLDDWTRRALREWFGIVLLRMPANPKGTAPR